MANKEQFILLGGPSSIGKSAISKILKEEYGINCAHKRNFNSDKNFQIKLLETHYSSNEADKKYSKYIAPNYEDFFSEPSPNLNTEIFENFDENTFFNFICLYANPKTILERAKKRLDLSGRKPRSLDKEVIEFETGSEIRMGKQIKNSVDEIFRSEFNLIDTNNKSPEELAKSIYSKFFGQ